MTFAVVLLILGLLLIFIEFYLPGAVFGVAGSLLIFASFVLFASNVDSTIAVLLYITGSFVAVWYLVRFALWKVRHSGPSFNVYLDKDQEGYYASKYDESAIGKTGHAFTELRPGGYVIVEGKKHAAISTSGYVSKDAQIEVIGGQEESLIVQERKK